VTGTLIAQPGAITGMVAGCCDKNCRRSSAFDVRYSSNSSTKADIADGPSWATALNRCAITRWGGRP